MASSAELTVRTGRVKQARRLASRAFRQETGDFLAEGPQAVREALICEGDVVEVFATVEASRRYPQLRDASGALWTEVSDDVLDYIADSVQPQGMVARCRSPIVSFDTLADDADYLVICANIRDPGNAGAVIRCADAAGADAVIFTGDSTDPLNPKAVRATAGSLFHLPILLQRDSAAVLGLLRSRGIQILAADGSGETGLYDADLNLRKPTAWLLGNEAWGLPEELRRAADRVVAVPIYGQAESLNLATAAAVCLYAGARVRHS